MVLMNWDYWHPVARSSAMPCFTGRVKHDRAGMMPLKWRVWVGVSGCMKNQG
jgi:hypothetical protein